MTHIDYERAKFALEHAKKQRSRRYAGLVILFYLAWAVVAAAFIASGAAPRNDGWSALAVLALFYGFLIPWGLAEIVVERPRSKLNHLIDDLRDKVRIHETAAWNPYEERLHAYFTAMFRKRSGSDWFATTLDQYGAKIEEARRLTADFRQLAVGRALDDHASYYRKRVFDHQYAGTVRDVSAVAPSQPRTRVAPPPPEKTYRAPRKVDWSALNQKGAVTGMKGEDVALGIEQEYLRSVGRKDLADRVSNHAQTKGDGLGYDILSFFADGREKYIEVKSTTGALKTSFYLSKNELGFLGEHKDDAFLYRVSLQNGGASLRVFTAAEVEEQEIAPVQFLVKIV